MTVVCLCWRRARATPALVAALLTLAGPVSAQQGAAANLADLSLEQLREVVVTSVSRRTERLDGAAASVYVISAEDIRRSGATTLPEALRLAPTLDVARADAVQYAISARGFDNVLANKMLVVIDGRAVYSPLFSGVFWEAQDVMLEDVERIEVVSGASTALWGSNAVNGLINVVTRSSRATQGPGVSLAWSSRERDAAFRYGAAPDAGRSLRIYAKTYDRRETHRADGSPIGDAAEGTQAGFRADWSLADAQLTLQGDAYRAAIDQGAATPRRLTGANLLGRWSREFGGGADASVQVYVDRTTRDQPPSLIETLETVDVIAQYGFQAAERHRVLLGGGYRRSSDEVTTFKAVGFNPPSRSLAWARAFVQDDVALASRVAMTLSTSVETNPYTAAQLLPSVRLAYRPAPGTTWWAAASRAVRAPSRLDREFVQPAQPPYLVSGGPNFVSEVAEVYELGYRDQPVPALAYSVTLFQHEHSRLRVLSPTPQGLQFENGRHGFSRGVEAWARWRVTERWRVDVGATLLRQQLHLDDGAVDVGGAAALGNDPRQWWTLRSSADLSAQLSWDVSVRHVGQLPDPVVPSYTAVDTRIAWRLSPSTELALTVQNVFDPRHAEWGVSTNRVELERSALLQLRVRL